jgi:hypothetical protein
MHSTTLRTGIFWLCLALMLHGCGREEPEAAAGSDPAAAASPGETSHYRWYMEAHTPAGESTLVRSGDGRVTNETFVHWNNREYTIDSVLELDSEGNVLSHRITGISPFQAPIEEQFVYDEGSARWHTRGGSGSAEGAQPGFYLPAEWGAIESSEALVRIAARRLDGEVPLFPAGTAKVSKVRDLAIDADSGEETLSLYAIDGVGFHPTYVWLDEDLRFAAAGSSSIAAIRADLDPALLKRLTGIGAEARKERTAELARSLTHTVEAPVVIENVSVVDVEGGRALPGRNVHIAGGKIVSLDSSDSAGEGALRIDGSGRFLVPGLWDMHGHFDAEDGILNIAGGITNVRDIGGEHDMVMDKTAKFASGAAIGPAVYRAGFMDKAGPFASGWSAESLDDALARVGFFADEGYIQVKLYSSIEPDWVAPIAERAHARGMRVSGHIPAFMSAEQAVAAGYDEIQHINMVFLNFLAGDREDTRKQLRFTLYGDEAGNLDLESDEVQAFFDLLAENDVVIDPTAAIFDTQLRHLPGDPDPTFAAIVEHLPVSVSRPLYDPDMDMGDMVDAWGRSAEKQAQMLKALYDNGIQLVPGSDAMAPFTIHRELELYAEAGIPVAAVLRIATLDSARVVGADDSKGSIAPGKDADLVLLDGNPLEDISAVRRGLLVIRGERFYRPEELYRAVGVRPFLPSTEIPQAEL